MKRRCPGFTLLEGVVIILILGILSIVALPKFSEVMVDISVSGAADRLKMHLEYMRRTSITLQDEYTATFNSTSGNYKIDLPDPEDTGRNISGPINGCKIAASGKLSFDIGGSPKLDGELIFSDFVIPLNSADGSKSCTITVSPVTGFIEVSHE